MPASLRLVGVTMIAGLFIKKLLLSNTHLLYWILGLIVVTIALSGLVRQGDGSKMTY